MDEKNDMDKVDDVMLPGFRFHPTDEELVGFYLKRKIQQRPLSIELIKQLDIYKYDPWDLPKMATTGEKEWYFYCPRDRKYRNSARPNRVTGAGFWKATGTDRPIYASEGTKCIGLKKSLVFYKGRAAKGIKTDWMMHEFRLPSVSDSSTHPKRPIDKNLPANDSWAICRIFKKTNSMAQRALSRSWVSPAAETSNSSDIYSHLTQGTNFGSQSISCTSESGTAIQFCCNNELQQPSSLDDPSYKHMNPTAFCKPSFLPISATEIIPSASFMFAPPLEITAPPKPGVDFTSMLLNLSPSVLGEYPSRSSGSIDFGSHKQSYNNMGMYESVDTGEGESCCLMNSDTISSHGNNQWVSLRTLAFPFNLTSNLSDAWKPSSSSWDSLPCPTQMSTTNYSTNKCYI